MNTATIYALTQSWPVTIVEIIWVLGTSLFSIAHFTRWLGGVMNGGSAKDMEWSDDDA